MTHDVRPRSEAQALQDISSRLYKVEQRSSSAQPGGTGTTPWDSNPDVDTITIDGVVVGADASPATGLTLSTAAFMEDVWIDADWSPPSDDTAANYDVELSKKTGSSYDIVQNYRTGTGTGIRMHALEPQTTYGVRVTAINRIGVRSDPLPAIGFTDITTGIDATVPAQVVGLTVTAGFRGFILTWDSNIEADVINGRGQYQYQSSFDTGVNFEASGWSDEFTGATVASVTLNTTTSFPMYFRVRAIDASGNAGAWSTIVGPVSMTTVATIDLSNVSVTTPKIANAAINNSKLAILSVDAANLIDGSVTNPKIGAAAVATSNLANLAVDNSKLAALSVDAAKLATGAVTSTKIANLAVGTAAIAALAVGSAQIADAAIVTAKIGDAQISTAKIQDLAVGSAAIAALAVGSAKIADAAILTAKIGDLQVTTAKMNDLAVTNAKIANLAVDNAKINDLDAVKITAGTINAARIAANSIDVDKLTTSTLVSKTITLGAGGTLKIGTAPTTGVLINDQGIRLYSGGVVKVALDVAGTASFEGNISASTITSSTLTSATINSGTITGTTVRTAASGQRVAMEAGVLDSIKLYSGNASESSPGRMLVAISGSSLICQVESPRSTGNDWALQNVQSVTGGNGSSCNWIISNGSSVTRAFLSLTCASNGSTPQLAGSGISQLNLSFGGGANAEARLVGSGNYGFLYLHGGGFVATLNVNIGLGAGFHVMNNTNATFLPVQASAFNVSSARKVKMGIKKETLSALDRLRKVEVVRFKRKPGADVLEMTDLPAHIDRELNLEEIGLIADDLLGIMPEAVQLGEDGQARSISLGVLVAVLIKAVQELADREDK